MLNWIIICINAIIQSEQPSYTAVNFAVNFFGPLATFKTDHILMADFPAFYGTPSATFEIWTAAWQIGHEKKKKNSKTLLKTVLNESEVQIIDLNNHAMAVTLICWELHWGLKLSHFWKFGSIHVPRNLLLFQSQVKFSEKLGNQGYLPERYWCWYCHEYFFDVRWSWLLTCSRNYFFFDLCKHILYLSTSFFTSELYQKKPPFSLIWK